MLPPRTAKFSGARPTSTASAAMLCRSVISSGGMVARCVRHQAFLLRDVELRGGAGEEALPDQAEHAGRGGEIVARDAQRDPARQHLKIGVGDGGHCA